MPYETQTQSMLSAGRMPPWLPMTIALSECSPMSAAAASNVQFQRSGGTNSPMAARLQPTSGRHHNMASVACDPSCAAASLGRMGVATSKATTAASSKPGTSRVRLGLAGVFSLCRCLDMVADGNRLLQLLLDSPPGGRFQNADQRQDAADEEHDDHRARQFHLMQQESRQTASGRC